MTNEKTVKIRTLCKDCVFNIKVGDDQIDCKLDRLTTYMIKKTPMERVDGSYILETLCNACRDSEWAKDKDNNELINSIYKEIEPKIDYIIVCNEEVPFLNKIKRSINAILKQDIEPNKILVSVKNQGKFIHSQLYNEVSKDIFVNQSVEFISKEKNIDNCVRHCTGTYYTTINAGEEINSHFSYIVNYLINERLEPFVMLESSEDFPTLILCKIHRMFSGNSGISIEEKIRILEKEQNSHMIKKWEDVIEI